MKATPALIGLDLGTTVCKSIVFDEQLRILAAAEQNYPLITLSDTEIEQDAELWWEVSKTVIRTSVTKAQIDPQAVLGISVSAQGIAVVPVDRQGTPLRPALSWLDIRAVRQRDQILEPCAVAELFRITGKRAHAAYVLPTLLCIKQHEPQLYQETYKFLMPLDFILAKLCAAYITDHTMASGTLCYDICRQCWSDRILDAVELDKDKLPQIAWSGTPVGTLHREAAEALGLNGSVIVSVGGQDQKVAALGAGIDLERTTISLGTAMAITQKSTRPLIDDQMRIPCFTDLLREHWVIEGSGNGTACLDWLKNTLFPDKDYDELNALAWQEEGKKNPVFFYPYFLGAASPHYVEKVRGFLYGLTFAVNAGQIIRSVFEGIAFCIRENIEVMQALNRPIRGFRLFGGGSKSALWAQIIAAVTGIPVTTLYTPECGCVGAAILAGLGAERFESAEGAFDLIDLHKCYEPEKKSVGRYEQQYQDYRRIGDRILKTNQ